MSIKHVAEFIREEPDVQSYGETQICHSVVNELIRALGWSLLGRNDVHAQYPIHGDYLDYCLAPLDRNKVFLEVKRPKENLADHEPQLLKYAFGEGVGLGVLTNGIEWRFCLPLTDGAWADRLFFCANLVADNFDHLETSFHTLLSKDCVLSGEAHNAALRLLETRRSASAIEKTLPAAWSMILSGPAPRMTALVAEAVEEMCGAKPSDETIAAFLKARLAGTPNFSKQPMVHAAVKNLPPHLQKVGKARFEIGIPGLLAQGLLIPGQEIFRVHLHKTYTATIDEFGHIGFPDGKKFPSISAAGKHITNAQDRGWTLFQTKTADGRTVSLHDLRLIGQSQGDLGKNLAQTLRAH